MKIFKRDKDGGPKSTVTGYWLIEIKWLFSIVLLKFEDGSRDEYHSHAFNSLNWVLSGGVEEQHLRGNREAHRPSWRPVFTRRSTFHRVVSRGTTWVFSIRGPWRSKWREYDPRPEKDGLPGRLITLTHGRKVVSETSTPS